METYKKVIRSRLSDYRYHHSLCVADAAKKLAKFYKTDEKKAEIAGVLHDVMKDTPKNIKLQMMEQFGIILDDFEKASEVLWHAKLGAAFAEQQLQIKDSEIIDAIRYHTTGKENMSLFTKIIFIADFISDDRTYSGVEEMRKMAFESLEEAMLEGFAFTFKKLSEQRRVIHPSTLSAYNFLIIEDKKGEAD